MEPYYQDDLCTIYHGDSRELLPALMADAILTDPPYGVGKAAWDEEYPLWWHDLADAAVPVVGVMPGVANLARMPERMGRLEYRWMLVVHLSNGMTRGAIGFGNFIPLLLYAAEEISVYQQTGDLGRVAVDGRRMPNHPSPKPIKAMEWFVARLPGESVLDPFMGSGSTLLAAQRLGRRAIGIEIEERYCEVAARRLQVRGILDRHEAAKAAKL